MIQQFTILFWVLCQFLSYFVADYSEAGEPVNGWDHFGWLWYKVGVLLLMVSAVSKRHSKLQEPFEVLIVFFCIKIVWNIIAIIGGYDINDPLAVKILFILLSAFICKLIIQDKWQRQNSSIG